MDSGLIRIGALCRSAQILGGSRALRAYLNVSALVLAGWMSGTAPPPRDVFLKVVDLIVEKDLQDLNRH